MKLNAARIRAIVHAATYALATGLFAGNAQSAPLVLNPVSDGAIYTCVGCNPVADGAYVLVAGYIQGIVKFSTAQIGPNLTQATLSLNPYGLPLFDKTVDVYGYGTSEGSLTAADGFAGTYLGTWQIPENLGYGQDTYFDVTAFLATVNAPYVAFNLRSDSGTDVFSSLEYNYGHPAQLSLTTVPVPGGVVLFGSALAGLVSLRRRQLQSAVTRAA